MFDVIFIILIAFVLIVFLIHFKESDKAMLIETEKNLLLVKYLKILLEEDNEEERS